MVKLTERVQNMWLAATNKLPATTGKRQRVAKQVIQQQFALYRQDLGKWRLAQIAASDLNHPDREPLYNLYNDITVDAHLTSVMQTRKINVMGKPFKVVNFNSGKEDKTKTNLFKAPWFRKFLSLAMDAEFYGHSLVEFGDLQDGYFMDVYLVPRSNVVPEFGIVKESVYGGGWERDFRNDPTLWLIEVGEERNLGLLEKAAPHVLWKKAAAAAWSEYCQVFGMPLRVGKTEAQGVDRQIFAEALKNMAESSSVVLDHDEEIEFVQVTRSDAYEVYDKRIERANSEISKLILGQTMTTEDGSSRSQAEVHERVSESYTKDDQQNLADLINFKLIPFLIERGYPLQGFSFQWDESETLSLKDQWSIVDGVVKNGYIVPETYITETFGIPVEGRKEPQKLPPADPEENFKKGLPVKGAAAGRKALMTVSMRSFFAKFEHTCNHKHEPTTAFLAITAQNPALDREIERLITDFHAGRVNNIILDSGLYREINKTLNSAIQTGYGDAAESEIAFLKDNLQVFSAFKTHHELRTMSDMLVDTSGVIRSFADYKKEVLRMHQQYNVNWLQSEYQHAVGSAQMARKWKDFERDGGLITYQTVGDQRVRPEHIEYDEVTLPTTHDWWNTHYPPNGWKCRCTVTDGDGEPTAEATLAGLPGLPDPMFEGNVGKTGIIFPVHHPYLNVTPEVKQQVLEQLAEIEGRPYLLTKKGVDSLTKKGVQFSGAGDRLENYNSRLQGFNLEELVADLDAAATEFDVKWTSKTLRISRPTEGNAFLELIWQGKWKRREINLHRKIILENNTVRIYHALFTMPEGLQGGGFGKRILSIFNKQYKTSAIRYVDVTANIDVGGYAWAKYGFTAENEREVRNAYRVATYKKLLTAEQLAEVDAIIEDYYKKHPGGKAFPMNDLANKSYGKDLLLDTYWRGNIDLRNPEQVKIFEDYLNKTKGK